MMNKKRKNLKSTYVSYASFLGSAGTELTKTLTKNDFSMTTVYVGLPEKWEGLQSYLLTVKYMGNSPAADKPEISVFFLFVVVDT